MKASKGAELDDPSGLLEWLAKDLKARLPALGKILRQWIRRL